MCLTAFANFLTSVAFGPASRVLSRKVKRVLSTIVTTTGQIQRITSREFALNMMFGVGSGGSHHAATSHAHAHAHAHANANVDSNNHKSAGGPAEIKMETRTFLNWWFSNQPVRPAAAAVTAADVAEPLAAEPANGGFTFDVVAVADFDSGMTMLDTTAPMETAAEAASHSKSNNNNNNKGAVTFASRASFNNGVVGFMDIDPKSAASKQHRNHHRQTWLQL